MRLDLPRHHDKNIDSTGDKDRPSSLHVDVEVSLELILELLIGLVKIM